MVSLPTSDLEPLIHRQRTILAIIDDMKSTEAKAFFYEWLVRHVRSAAPMQLLSVGDVIEPLQAATVPLQDGARIELATGDGVRALSVTDGQGNEVAVPLGQSQGEQLVLALRAVAP